MRLTGRLTSGGRPVALDLVLTGERGGRGTITAAGVTFSVIRIGELLWFKAPRAFYARQPELPVALLADRWLEAPASNSQFSELAALTRASKVASQVLTTGEDLTEAPTTLQGTPAIALSTARGTVVVSRDAPVRPLRAEGAGAAGDALVFAAYDAPVDLRKPDRVVTAAQVAAAQRQGR